jgi:hypothetical protein
MKKFFKWAAIIIGVLIVVLFIAFKFMQSQTKKASPEQTVEYKKDGKEITVFYCRPYKNGREIFGGLVPYGQVWRTGANEASTFKTNKDLNIGGKTLPAGKYTLWTIPEKEEWTVIFNGKQYGWGVTFGGVAAREASEDVLQVKVPVQETNDTIEQFTISFADSTDLNMVLAWDKTKIAVPIK